ncbi:MAG TPA: DUF4105 domain-containing protein [Burkholderiales bacterium]|nr:DUF4105 domain-containing protein [Burkholderiales bacterium]
MAFEVLKGLLLAWGALAVYFMNEGPLGAALAAGFLAFGAWALWLTRRRAARVALAVALLGVAAWLLTLAPSHEREWRPEVAVMPRAFVDGDRVRITGVRNFDYRSQDDFTVRYQEREVRLSHLVALDFFLSYWRPGPVGHTFLSFVFDDAPPLTISIETRPEVGETFDPLGSLFRKFELIYVVGEERDLVRVRTNYRDEEVYLYRLRTSAENARRLFLVYLERINELADRAEFYHLLSNSCTINIVRYANRLGRTGGFDPRHLLNGWSDRYLYDAGVLDPGLSFDELRARAHINNAAHAAGDGADFSTRIRASAPVMAP